MLSFSSQTAYRPVTLLDSILAHDVEDAVPDGVPIAPTPGQARHCQPGKEPALGILAGPGLQLCQHPLKFLVVSDSPPQARELCGRTYTSLWLIPCKWDQ